MIQYMLYQGTNGRWEWYVRSKDQVHRRSGSTKRRWRAEWQLNKAAREILQRIDRISRARRESVWCDWEDMSEAY